MRKFTFDSEIRALSWRQPYADLMLAGKIETRTWKTKYRGWVLICSSKQSYRLDQIEIISGRNSLIRIADLFQETDCFTMKTGHAIAIGYLSDCRLMRPEDEEACMVKYYPGLYCHVFEDVQILPQAFPWIGKQGWGKVPDEVKKQIFKMLEP